MNPIDELAESIKIRTLVHGGPCPTCWTKGCLECNYTGQVSSLHQRLVKMFGTAGPRGREIAYQALLAQIEEILFRPCPSCTDAEWNQSDDCLIAQYGYGCETCNDTGLTPAP